MTEELKKVEELRQRLESLQADKQLRAHVPLDFREAVRDAIKRPGRGELRVGGFNQWRERIQAMRAAQKESRRLKAYSVPGNAGARGHIEGYHALKSYPLYLHDLFVQMPMTSKGGVTIESWVNTTGVAEQWDEGQSKQIANRTHFHSDLQLQYYAITETYSQKVVDFLGEAALDVLALDLMLRVEDAIHAHAVTNVIAGALAFPAATYAGTVPNATWADTIALAISHDSYPTPLADPRTEWPVDVVVLPRRYYALFPVSLKETTGARLYGDFSQAFAADVETTFHTLTSNPLPNIAVALRSQAFHFAHLDEVRVYNERIVDAVDEQNLYRITVEVPIAIVPIYRALGSTLTAYSIVTNLVDDTTTINV